MAKKQRQPMSADGSLAARPPYTAKQGQYLAFIHCYQKVRSLPRKDTRCLSSSSRAARRPVSA